MRKALEAKTSKEDRGTPFTSTRTVTSESVSSQTCEG